jgi:hypothetical protein
MLAVCVTLCGCASGGAVQPETEAAPPTPPTPPPPGPPPVDLAGRWKLAAAAGGGCMMTFGDTPGATDGTIAPAGGCPGNFFTSRKWTYEHERLIIRNHKGEVLAELAFTGSHFEGKSPDGTGLTLAR